jgi:hypothetical protein
LFIIQVEFTLPFAFVYFSLFSARLNASHKEIRTHGKGGGVKKRVLREMFGRRREELIGTA